MSENETAITVRKGIEASEKLGKYFVSLMGEGFTHLGEAFSDWAQAYRYKNLLKLAAELNIEDKVFFSSYSYIQLNFVAPPLKVMDVN